MSAREGSAPRVFSNAAIEQLKTLTWPGNIRELRNTVERLLILSDGSVITSDDVDSLTISRARSADPGRELLALSNFSAFKEAIADLVKFRSPPLEGHFLIHRCQNLPW